MPPIVPVLIWIATQAPHLIPVIQELLTHETAWEKIEHIIIALADAIKSKM